MLVGLDIGGTKCAVCVGKVDDGGIGIVSREEFPTAGLPWQDVLGKFAAMIEAAASRLGVDGFSAIGISCGGPLDSTRGVILSPPNLPGWDEVFVVDWFRKRFGIPVALQNDANACAVAEHRYGAGRGTRNMVFLTFGTGFGAGLIIDGKLYEGANGNAGEIGHVRLAPNGPWGYGKDGSAEGFCSGGGISRLAKMRKGLDLTTKELFARVREGDPDCTAVFEESAEKLGLALSLLIDVLNPEVIALGGVFMRNADLFMPVVERTLERESLPFARAVCRIVPAQLGERIGDCAAIAIAEAVSGV